MRTPASALGIEQEAFFGNTELERPDQHGQPERPVVGHSRPARAALTPAPSSAPASPRKRSRLLLSTNSSAANTLTNAGTLSIVSKAVATANYVTTTTSRADHEGTAHAWAGMRNGIVQTAEFAILAQQHADQLGHAVHRRQLQRDRAG